MTKKRKYKEPKSFGNFRDCKMKRERDGSVGLYMQEDRSKHVGKRSNQRERDKNTYG